MKSAALFSRFCLVVLFGHVYVALEQVKSQLRLRLCYRETLSDTAATDPTFRPARLAVVCYWQRHMFESLSL